MYRTIVLTCFFSLGSPVWADSFTTSASVDRVTIYPGLSEVTRQIVLDLPEGQHDVTVPGLPETLSTEGLRVSAPAGL